MVSALGKPLLAHAAVEVAKFAGDSELETPATVLMYLTTVFESADMDAMDNFPAEAQRAVITLQQISQRGSRNFKERMGGRLD